METPVTFAFSPSKTFSIKSHFQVIFDLLANKFVSLGKVLINENETFTYLHWLNLINTELPSMERIMLQLLCYQACSKRKKKYIRDSSSVSHLWSFRQGIKGSSAIRVCLEMDPSDNLIFFMVRFLKSSYFYFYKVYYEGICCILVYRICIGGWMR